MSVSEAWFLRVKAAQRDLIKLAGGIERASEITSVSKSHIGRMNNAADPELMPLSAVYALQAECGVPVVTSALAELAGRRLSDPDVDRQANICVQQSKAALIGKVGELMSCSAVASSDGFFSIAEARQMDRLAADMERELGRFRQSLAIVASRGGENVGLRVVGEE